MNKKIADLAPRKAAMHVATQVASTMADIDFETFAKANTKNKDLILLRIKKRGSTLIARFTDGNKAFEAYISGNTLHPKQAMDNLVKLLSKKPR